MGHQLNDTDIGSQSIYLHSNDATITISSSEKIFYFKKNIIAPSGYKLLIGLTNLTMPNTMYNVTSSSNNIVINDGTTDHSFDITVGNYTAEDLATEINTAISAYGGCNFESDNNVFEFTLGTNTIQSTTMLRQLGLRDQLPTGNDSGSSKYTAKNVCDMGGVTNIYLRLRNLTMNNIDSRGLSSNIISSIVNPTNYGGYIFYQPPEVLYYLVAERAISHLDIEMTDQEGNLLELNGVDFNLTFTVHYSKERESSVRDSMLQEIKKQHVEKIESEKIESEKKNNNK